MSSYINIDRDRLAYAIKRKLAAERLTYQQAADQCGVSPGVIVNCINQKDIRSLAFVRIMMWVKQDVLADDIEIITES